MKNALIEICIEKIVPISQQLRKLAQDKSYIDKIIKEGAQKARDIAEVNIKEIKEIVGYL